MFYISDTMESFNEYRIKVYDSLYDTYINWGDVYFDKEECLKVFKNYLATCKKIVEKYSGDTMYNRHLKDYTSKPIIIKNRRITKLINNLEDEYMEIKGD